MDQRKEKLRCKPRARCRNDRQCDICARIRQAKAARAAERIFEREPVAYLTVLKPQEHTEKSINDLRRRFLRLNSPTAYLWSIETGETLGQLHLNIIHNKTELITKNMRPAYHERIRTNPAIVAAYITKKTQRPPESVYPGPTIGASLPIRSPRPTQQPQPMKPENQQRSQILWLLTTRPASPNIGAAAARILLKRFYPTDPQNYRSAHIMSTIAKAEAKLERITKVYDCPELATNNDQRRYHPDCPTIQRRALTDFQYQRLP